MGSALRNVVDFSDLDKAFTQGKVVNVLDRIEF
jgi:hypothetical protein